VRDYDDGTFNANLPVGAYAPLPPTQRQRAEARMKGYVGESCPECGNFIMVRNGACLKCDTCGGGRRGVADPMATAVRDIIHRLETDGWYVVATRGSHRQYVHPAKKGRVTVPGKLSADLQPGTLKSILRQAGLKD
jgi:predicted RNA binding protein YcfA (HicA-like mRNA interferase family)